MAEAILSPIFRLALESLRSKIQDEISVIWGVEKDLENLLGTMSEIESAIADAEEKQARNESMRDWLEKLKHVVYEVDNILDEYAYEAHGWKLQLQTESRRNKQVSNLLSCLNCFKKVAFRHNIGQNIKDFNRRLDKIAKELNTYYLRDGVPEMNNLERPETYFRDDSQVLGRKDEKENIIKLLLSSLPSSSSSSSSHDGRRDDLFVISIVGLGGLGRTSLAQSVYNDENVKEHFHACMWVHVSENFEIKSIVKMIIEFLTKENCRELSLEALQENLRRMLSWKRFLLVLDDVWNEDQMKWEGLIRLLIRCGGEGSRMIVTTCSRTASPTSIPNTTIYLECLSEDDCWKLFKQCAFRWRTEEECRQLITISQEIAKKCQGVPLVAKTIGGLMHNKRYADEWEVIRDSELWDFEADGKGILNSLRISYNHLPSYLKQCFVYCSIFPKDYYFEKEKLIKLWMAQGFIHQPSTQSNEQMEDVGNDYFNGLLWRSFFQDVERDKLGNIWRCKMHDRLHDLAQSIGKNDCSIIQVGKPKEVIANKVYHSSFAYDGQETPNLPKEMYDLYKCSSYLRSLVMFENYSHVVPNDLFSKLRYLRMLDLSGCKITKIPDSIGNMIHLRYLNLSRTDIQRLPEMTCNLLNLQTLNIEGCQRLSELPRGLKNMINLRHLEMEGSDGIDCMPSGIGRLTCLQTLPIYIVGVEKECGLGELQDLLNLRGTLTIKKLENTRNMEESKKANLNNKEHLHTLEFYWSEGRTINAEEEEGTLEGLQPHSNLRDLNIVNYGGVMFPSWLSNSSLTNLESLSLYYMDNCNDWSTIGESNLSKLSITGFKKLRALPKLANLKELVLKFCDEMVMTLEHLPSLETLSISFCDNITSLPESLRTLSTLRTLRIWRCSKLGSLPKLANLKELDLSLCDEMVMTLEHLPSLETLSISFCSNITSLLESLRTLSTLRTLKIRSCSKLGSLPKLANLKELDLSLCDERVMTLEHLPSLETLSISFCDNITSLPESLGTLSALRTLKIRYCSKLGSLPKELKHLAALECLEIKGCPLLTERCRERGQDRDKIAHIRYKLIDGHQPRERTQL